MTETHVPARQVLGQLVALQAALRKTINRGEELAEMAGNAYVASLFGATQRQAVRDALTTVTAEIARVSGDIDAVETGAIGPPPPPEEPTKES